MRLCRQAGSEGEAVRYTQMCRQRMGWGDVPACLPAHLSEARGSMHTVAGMQSTATGRGCGAVRGKKESKPVQRGCSVCGEGGYTLPLCVRNTDRHGATALGTTCRSVPRRWQSVAGRSSRCRALWPRYRIHPPRAVRVAIDLASSPAQSPVACSRPGVLWARRGRGRGSPCRRGLPSRRSLRRQRRLSAGAAAKVAAAAAVLAMLPEHICMIPVTELMAPAMAMADDTASTTAALGLHHLPRLLPTWAFKQSWRIGRRSEDKEVREAAVETPRLRWRLY